MINILINAGQEETMQANVGQEKMMQANVR